MYIFDEIPVTESDIETWIDNVKNLSPLKSRRDQYRKNYNVEEKIRHAKASGQWPPKPPSV